LPKNFKCKNLHIPDLDNTEKYPLHGYILAPRLALFLKVSQHFVIHLLDLELFFEWTE